MKFKSATLAKVLIFRTHISLFFQPVEPKLGSANTIFNMDPLYNIQPYFFGKKDKEKQKPKKKIKLECKEDQPAGPTWDTWPQK